MEEKEGNEGENNKTLGRIRGKEKREDKSPRWLRLSDRFVCVDRQPPPPFPPPLTQSRHGDGDQW